MTSTQEELIRHRIEKRLAGRRDLALHLLVYALVMILMRISLPWWGLPDLAVFGVLWAIPLMLNALRYYYQCGPGLKKRAQAIDQELDRYAELATLDDEEELLIEDRVAKKFKARRLVVAHLWVMLMILGSWWLDAYIKAALDTTNLEHLTQVWGIAFLAHWLRFYFVHGRGPAGRALKIEKEIERQWSLVRARQRQRQDLLESSAPEWTATIDLERLREGQPLVADDGELIDQRLLLEQASEAQTEHRGASR